MKHARSGVLRWGARAAAAVALGAGVTLVTAYGGAVKNQSLGFGGYGNGELHMMRETNRWWDVVKVLSDGSSGLADVRQFRGVVSWEPNTLADLFPPESTDGKQYRQVVMIGWPARCLWGVEGLWRGPSAEGLTDAPEWVKERWPIKRQLPTAVWWPGMAVNSAVFGAACLPVVIAAERGAGWLWFRRRRHKGVCVQCGYDRSGLAAGVVCPECGSGA